MSVVHALFVLVALAHERVQGIRLMVLALLAGQVIVLDSVDDPQQPVVVHVLRHHLAPIFNFMLFPDLAYTLMQV